MATPTPAPTPAGCADLLSCQRSGIEAVLNSAGDAVNGAVQTIDFWTDPWGNTFKALQTAAHGLAESVLPTVTSATLPNLNATWFLSAYAVAFALAIFVAVVLLLPQFVRTARGVQSGRELAESVGLYFPLFLVSAMFGPPFGVILVNFFQSISDSIIRWGVTGSAATVTTKFQQMLTADDAAGIAGGAPVGVLLMLLMLTGLLLVVVMLIVQLVTLYFTGVLLPLGLVWIIDPGRRRFGTRIVTLWVGILASHPLLFFLLAIAYLMVSGSVDAFSSGADLASTVQLIVSVLALFLAGLSPFVLMKLAPILPTGGAATTGPALTGAAIGARNLTEADSRYGETPPAAGPPTSQTPLVSGGGDSAAPPAPTIGAPTAISGTTPDQETSSTGPTKSTTAPAAAGADSGATDGATPESEVAPLPSAPAKAATSTAAAAEPAVAGGGTAAAAGDAAVAVGASESATGVGAAVGIPTILAGVALKGSEVAHGMTEFVQDTTETVGEHATAALDNAPISGGSSRG